MVASWQLIEMFGKPHLVIIFICKMIAKICIISLFNMNKCTNEIGRSVGQWYLIHFAYWKWSVRRQISYQFKCYYLIIILLNKCKHTHTHTFWGWMTNRFCRIVCSSMISAAASLFIYTTYIQLYNWFRELRMNSLK